MPLDNFLSQLKLSPQIHTLTKIEHQSLAQLIPLDMNLSISNSYSLLSLGSSSCSPPTSLIFARRLSCYIFICIPCTSFLGYCSLLDFIILSKGCHTYVRSILKLFSPLILVFHRWSLPLKFSDSHQSWEVVSHYFHNQIVIAVKPHFYFFGGTT